MDLVQLPDDLFKLLVSYLAPADVLACLRVSRRWRGAFGDADLCRTLLKRHFPRAREVRELLRGHANGDSSNLSSPTDFYEGEEESLDYVAAFTRVANRYHRLASATPCCVERLPLETTEEAYSSPLYSTLLTMSMIKPQKSWLLHYPLSPWQRYLQFEDKAMPFDYRDTLWTYDEGILIYPCAVLQSFALYDLNCGSVQEIDLDCTSKILRRVRLVKKVLVVEWCEQEAFHQLNETEVVFRHYATVYDIVQTKSSASIGGRSSNWKLVFRNEWKIHFLGLPLNKRDRFFSTHTPTHYALYLWQPNRSAWGEDEPIEGLAVWDISSPSSYRPSLDQTGRDKPSENAEGPRLIRRFSVSDLSFYGIRQRETPTLTDLSLDEANVYIHLEDHCWMAGQHVGLTPPRLHTVKTVAIPFDGQGPVSVDACGFARQGEAGSNALPLCERTNDRNEGMTLELRLARCWRHERFPYLTASRVHDVQADIQFGFSRCIVFTSGIHSEKLYISGAGPEPKSLKLGLTKELSYRGRLAGDERFLIGENSEKEIVIAYFDRPKRHDTEGPEG